jgi:hypothetical protein
MRMHAVQVALEAYAAALVHNSGYDMRAMLRFVQLWLTHSDNEAVCSLVATALEVCSGALQCKGTLHALQPGCCVLTGSRAWRSNRAD